ncbi:butyrophilin-like protein 2, partial [Silurus meridionalis]
LYADVGDDVTLPCYLHPKKSAVAMKIRWSKEEECICEYQNGEVRVGEGYEGRVSLFTDKLKDGNVSLMLRNVQPIQPGLYNCEV